MTAAVASATRYLVEWYRPSLTREVIDDMFASLDRATAAMGAEGFPVWLLLTLAVPTDEVLYGVFAANDPELVHTACARAGAMPERMSLDVDARITEHVAEHSDCHPPRLVSVDDEPELLHPPAS